MIFDDHDLRNAWNRSQRWLDGMAAKAWWPAARRAALVAYWVYQHLGNLGPDELAADPLLREVRAAGGDAGHLVDLAVDATGDAGTIAWGYARDLGRVRLVVVDSRASRVLSPTRRAIVSAPEWDRAAAAARAARGRNACLLVVTSVPLLLPPAISDAEGWSEAVAGGAWGRPLRALGELFRALLDLEHWAAFRTSFDSMAELLRDVATGPGAPESVWVLSGDVHYSYAARARLEGVPPAGSAVWQLVCSPLRNRLAEPYRSMNAGSVLPPVRWACRLLARSSGVRDPAVRWRVDRGPWFANCIAVLDLAPGSGRAAWLAARDMTGPVEIGTVDLRADA